MTRANWSPTLLVIALFFGRDGKLLFGVGATIQR